MLSTLRPNATADKGRPRGGACYLSAMPKDRGRPGSGGASRPKPPVRQQVSAGGVAFRRAARGAEIVLIRPRGTERWQLPKGLVDPGESPELTAKREVREETGVDGEVVAAVDTIEYWYVGTERDGARVRYHKSVHFFLVAYRAGDVADHDREVAEARWVPLADALELLAFKNERAVVERAARLIEERL
jgi:8-oxo-dGTP pyrophosphatase MutT (NUDIX family)